MHLPQLIYDLAVILGAAAVVTFIFHKIKQPVALGYIAAGLLVGSQLTPFKFIKDEASLKVWADLGVIFLMFNLGLEFSFRKLSHLGRPIILTGLWEMGVMMALGYLTGLTLGWTSYQSVFLGAMISISSTTIIVKAFEDLRIKTRRFAEVVFGLLIVEDLVAVLILVMLSSLVKEGSLSLLGLTESTLRLFLIVGAWVLVGYFAVPKLVKYVGRLSNPEMLTVMSVALCLLLVTMAARFDYSPALGAFIMGSILAETREAERIEKLIRPLKDIFVAIFFVSIGLLVDLKAIADHSSEVLIISSVVMVGKILSVSVGSLATGQNPRRSIQISFSMAQIGEFSFIIASLGLTLKVINSFLYSVIVAVSLVTTLTTPYLMKASEKLISFIERTLPLSVQQKFAQRKVYANEKTETQLILSRVFAVLVACSILVVSAFQIVTYFIYPRLSLNIDLGVWSGAIGWWLIIFMTAPFLWAIFSITLSSLKVLKKLFHKMVVIFIFLASLIIMIHFSRSLLLNMQILVVSLLGAVLFFATFRQKLDSAFEWFKRQFLLTFEESDKHHQTKSGQIYNHLAPWDAHLVRIQVNPRSIFIAQTLEMAKLRENFGLNIVAIHRELQTIIAPTRYEVILPGDVFLCLGTDAQLEKARAAIESLENESPEETSLDNYELKSFDLGENSPLIGKSILESQIRAKIGALVVGIERGQDRIVNPTSEMIFQANDRLWIVGERSKLNELQNV